MKRGDVVLVHGTSGATTKPRPSVVVQQTLTLTDAVKITACPFSSAPAINTLVRPLIAPSAQNGLRQPSQVEIDWIFTERADRFGTVIGGLDPTSMDAIDVALRLWLDL